MNSIDFFNRAIRPVKQAINALIGRAVLKLVDDSTKMQLLQLTLLQGEVRDKIENFLPYGFSHHPLPGAEAAVVFPQGNRDHGICIAVSDRRFRIKNLQPGEVALYTDEGDTIIFKRGNKIEITAGVQVQVTAPLATINGNLVVTGSIVAGGGLASGTAPPVAGKVIADGDVESIAAATSLADVKTTYNTHTHPENGTGGGTTSVPNEPI